MGCVASRDVQAPLPLELQQAQRAQPFPHNGTVSKQNDALLLKSKQVPVPKAPPAIETTASVDFHIAAGGAFNIYVS